MNYKKPYKKPDELINGYLVKKFAEVLLVAKSEGDDEKKQLVKVSSKMAYEMAQDEELDLVCVSLKGDLPICKIVDYGKLKYQQKLKQRKQKAIALKQKTKQIKLRPQIGLGDLKTKTNQIINFLKQGHQVKVFLVFRGRENLYKEQGLKVIKDLFSNVKEFLKVEPEAKLSNNVYQAVLIPDTKKVVKNNNQD